MHFFKYTTCVYNWFGWLAILDTLDGLLNPISQRVWTCKQNQKWLLKRFIEHVTEIILKKQINELLLEYLSKLATKTCSLNWLYTSLEIFISWYIEREILVSLKLTEGLRRDPVFSLWELIL